MVAMKLVGIRLSYRPWRNRFLGIDSWAPKKLKNTVFGFRLGKYTYICWGVAQLCVMHAVIYRYFSVGRGGGGEVGRLLEKGTYKKRPTFFAVVLFGSTNGHSSQLTQKEERLREKGEGGGVEPIK
jgi:hypothetical protein